jgi:DNA-binding transcriptional MerR regulator
LNNADVHLCVVVKKVGFRIKIACVSRNVIAYIVLFIENSKSNMRTYTISRVAKLAGVSVRTLHHYDHIGLLTPSKSEKGYRYYDKNDLMRLQQILFYKELDFPLAEIKAILDDSDFDIVTALKHHRRVLEQRHLRTAVLLNTIDKTITTLTEEQFIMKEEELYEGFPKEKIDRWNKEVDAKYDPELVRQSREKVKRTTKGEWNDYKNQSDALNQQIADHMHFDPMSDKVQALIAKHHQGIEFFYEANADVYAGLAQLYVDNPEFTAYYEKIKPGMAFFMRDAMKHYAETVLREKVEENPHLSPI